MLPPQPHKEPWCDPSSDHRAALTLWQEISRRRYRSGAPMVLHFQALVLYNIRFLAPGEICGAWLSFGCLAAHLHKLDIVLNLSTPGNISASLSYDRLVRTDIQERARARGDRRISAPPSDSACLLKTENLKFKHIAILENSPVVALPFRSRNARIKLRRPRCRNNRHQRATPHLVTPAVAIDLSRTVAHPLVAVPPRDSVSPP